MKKLFVALAFLGTTAALAQQPQTPAGQRATQAPIAGGSVLGVEVSELSIVATGYRISKLLAQPVYNDKNAKIGKLEDFIVKPDGTLSYAILDVGGFLGVGAHRVAIPVGQFSDVRPRIVLPGATKDALKQMPEFRYSRPQT